MDLQELASSLLGSSFVYVLAGLVAIFVFFGDIAGIGNRYRKLPGASVIGARWSFEPAWINRYRLTLSGWAVAQRGWEAVTPPLTSLVSIVDAHDHPQTPSGFFTVIRPESNVTVIPRRYVDELSNIPYHRLAASEAIVNDMMRQYTRSDILLGGHLGHHAVKNKLSHQLSHLVDVIEEELLNAASDDPLEVTVKAISETTIIMRSLPRYTHPLICAVLPSRRRLLKCMEGLHGFLEPLIAERQQQESAQKSAYERPNDVIQWTIDLANEEESAPSSLADSFIKEISRHYPPSALAFRRITKETIVLSDSRASRPRSVKVLELQFLDPEATVMPRKSAK
ncbi:Uu.00g100090.m01.CDS01 [Anthostomella pinea]|uniref:Uu.00g100090.m01.CDS01 n=1 Tax=Anthostomella pinea TaxID=933095 RepID=A0AAI8VCS6_9PEZI|nr:Uu.00g100090.m01.CDS01 [Anthostomella pinea]